MTDFFKRLAAPFPAQQVSWRVGSTNKDKTKGMALAYLDARDVMERLDTVCGPENWQTRYPFAGCCELGIKVGGEWVWKTNGAGATDIEAEKGQFSDAFKRAAVLWGIGRYLYSLPSPWVELVDGRRFSDAAQADLTQRLHKWQERHIKDTA
jgi:hypothetical protein